MDHGDQMTPALRRSFFGRINNDPSQAFFLYRTCKWLSDEDDKILEAIFKELFKKE